MNFFANFEIPPIPHDIADKSQQQIVADIFQKMRSLNLFENNWQKVLNDDFSNQDAINSQLWECLVALYLNELAASPQRFPQTNANLDFGFSVNGGRYYGECVCVRDGDENENHGIQRFKDEDYKPLEGGIGSFASRGGTVAETANRVGLRVTQAISAKNEQARKFLAENDPLPTIIFLCTSFLSDSGIPISGVPKKQSSMPMPTLSSTVAATYGVDGVPSLDYEKETGKIAGFSARQSLSLDKSGEKIDRSCFRNGTFFNISAVCHFSGNLQSVCRQYLKGESIRKIFGQYAEFIVNPTCNGQIAVYQIDFLPEMRRLWIYKHAKIIIDHNDEQCSIWLR
jgi:hypothetical protein